MGDLELLPCHDATCPYFIGLHLEATIFEVEHVGFLCEDAG